MVDKKLLKKIKKLSKEEEISVFGFDIISLGDRSYLFFTEDDFEEVNFNELKDKLEEVSG